MNAKKKNIKLWSIIAGFIVILPMVWFLLVGFEGEKPAIILELPFAFIGKNQNVTISVADQKRGLRKIWVALLKDGKEIVLHEEAWPSAGIFTGGKVRAKKIQVKIEPQKSGIADGKAILRMAVWDYSWRNWWHGNQTYIEKNLTVDTKPPEIEVISRSHNLSQGGAGLVIYRNSEVCRQTGVYVGNNFFPGHSGYFKDRQIQMAFIGLGYQQGPGTEIFIKAVDQAGNSARAGLNHHIRKKVYKNDSIDLSDRFLNWKMPEFEDAILPDAKTSLVDKFLNINGELRQANYRQITQLVSQTTNRMHWKGAFLRLPRSATQAGFADQRVYRYKGRVIDRQVHMGVDLASVAHSPVPAANSGVVVFTGPLGIYGRTVLIDHGFGLFSMYSHLNRIAVKAGQHLLKGDILGRTGSTGLAGGDHLHFAILVHNTIVNPIEWWDAAWIKNNIVTKIDLVKSGQGRE